MSKPRILGGVAKGRSLETPKTGTRPSPAMLRGALFNILAFRERGAFLDLYSGSGAVGLEAASRGWSATCVDLSKEAAQVIRQNARALKLEVTVAQGDALKFARQHPAGFGIVFAAPPYPLDLPELFQTILEAGPAAPGGLYVFQHPSRLTLPYGERRIYGSNALTLLAAEGPEEP